MFCNKCGSKVPDEATFCPKCGSNLLEARKNYSSSNDFDERNATIESRPSGPKNLFIIPIAIAAALIIGAASFFAFRHFSIKKSEETVLSDISNSTKSAEDYASESQTAIPADDINETDIEETDIGEERSDSGDDNSWSDAYLDYLDDFSSTLYDPDEINYRTFGYIYVNDDDIPELLIQGEDEATGNLILTYSDGLIDELQTSRLYFDYLKKGNRLRNSDGNMGYYYDYIYSIENGMWKSEAHGEYYVEDNSADWDDDDLIYSWNDEQLTADEYNKKLKAVYDDTNAYPGDAVLSFDEIKTLLTNDSIGYENPYLQDDTAIHKYEVIVDDVSWEEALQDCKKRGGYLVRLNSSHEKYYIEDLLKENGQEKLVVWLGACLNPGDRHYHWFDGEKYSLESLDEDRYFRYNWLDSEPSFTGYDNNGSIIDENCMCMFQVNGFWEWNDVPADISPYYSGKIAYICEYE